MGTSTSGSAFWIGRPFTAKKRSTEAGTGDGERGGGKTDAQAAARSCPESSRVDGNLITGQNRASAKRAAEATLERLGVPPGPEGEMAAACLVPPLHRGFHHPSRN
jgi:putative intracellular protease/amidase